MAVSGLKPLVPATGGFRLRFNLEAILVSKMLPETSAQRSLTQNCPFNLKQRLSLEHFRSRPYAVSNE